MHFEILVEDVSGKIALEFMLDKILGPNGQDHSYKIIPYKGIGRIPKDLRGTTDPQKRILLDRLPKLLRGYGKSLQDFPAAVIVIVDLDDKDCLGGCPRIEKPTVEKPFWPYFPIIFVK